MPFRIFRRKVNVNQCTDSDTLAVPLPVRNTHEREKEGTSGLMHDPELEVDDLLAFYKRGSLGQGEGTGGMKESRGSWSRC